MTALDYPFTQEQMEKAHDEWGANCGPTALAFALQLPLETVRRAIPEFESKRYTSPTMMRAAIVSLHRNILSIPTKPPGVFADMFSERPAVVRIQIDGPWCDKGMNPKWAYWQTHWIATWIQAGKQLVFDCNGGAMTFDGWRAEIIPLIIRNTKRANGHWFPTHIWRIA